MARIRWKPTVMDLSILSSGAALTVRIWISGIQMMTSAHRYTSGDRPSQMLNSDGLDAPR
jgi:hypothetical protein